MKLKLCERCGSPLTGTMKYCENCGAPVVQQPKTVQRQRLPQYSAKEQQTRLQREVYAAREQQIRQRREPQPAPTRELHLPDPQQKRYQQEHLEKNWQQDWERVPVRPEQKKGATALDYILVTIMILLFAVLLGFAGFWFLGRDRQSGAQPANEVEIRQQEPTEDNDEDIIVILGKR